MLSKRLQLLGEVGRLAESLNIAGEVDYSCETAQHFYRFNVLARWEEYEANMVKVSWHASCDTAPTTECDVGPDAPVYG